MNQHADASILAAGTTRSRWSSAARASNTRLD
jgi:hypothetical protein